MDPGVGHTEAVHPIAIVAAVLAGLIHLWFFVIESVWFSRPSIWRRFGLTSDGEARVVHSFAFNQGFYNLFLAFGVGIGLLLAASGDAVSGRAIVLFACGSMVAAGVVLVLHNGRFLRAAATQIIPALVVILSVWLAI